MGSMVDLAPIRSPCRFDHNLIELVTTFMWDRDANSHLLTDFGTNMALTHLAAHFICSTKHKQQPIKIAAAWNFTWARRAR